MSARGAGAACLSILMRAGSLVSANNLYNVAPKDGSTFGAFARNIPQTPAIETTGVRQNV